MAASVGLSDAAAIRGCSCPPREENLMETTRRDFLTTAAAAGAAAAVPQHLHGQEPDHQVVPSDLTLRVKSIESLLAEKGLIDRAALDALVDSYEHKIGPHIGARVV